MVEGVDKLLTQNRAATAGVNTVAVELARLRFMQHTLVHLQLKIRELKVQKLSSDDMYAVEHLDLVVTDALEYVQRQLSKPLTLAQALEVAAVLLLRTPQHWRAPQDV